MAQKADSLNVEPTWPRVAPVAPLRIEKPPWEKPLAKVKKAATRGYRGTQARARRAYSIVIERSGVLTRNIRRKLQKTRSERPLQIVAAVATTGFVLGVVLRVWRSKRNE
jgi:hypothetical protein